MTVAIPGDFANLVPAPITQSDRFTVTVLLVSGTLVEAPLLRLTVEPTADYGWNKWSQVMIDKSMLVRRDKLGQPIGKLPDETMLSVTQFLAVFLGVA